MREAYDDNWASQLAKILKENRPQEAIGNVIGNVVSTSPLVISILDGNILINSEVHQIYLADDLTKETSSVCCSKIQAGDSVLVSTDVNEEVFFVTDRLVKVGV